jgi:hypothetical protein
MSQPGACCAKVSAVLRSHHATKQNLEHVAQKCQRFCDHTMRQNKNLDQGGFQGEKYGRSGSEQGTGRAFSCGLARESQKAASDKNPACAPVTIAWL